MRLRYAAVQGYEAGNGEMMKTREEQIAERRKQMPRSYRANYDRAVKGKSLRGAINAQCLECVCWVTKEVRLCTDLACPLCAVRPYQSSQNGRDGQDTEPEPKNSNNEGNG